MSDGVDVILASGSATRRRMLADAGLSFKIQPARVDEGKLKDVLFRHTACVPAADVAEALAEAKAIEVSSRNSGAWVIGSDQVLAQGEIIFSKAATRDEARSTLQALRGKTHSLHSAAALVQHGIVVWQHVQTANLTMRMFSDAWLEQYLDAAGDALVQSVGAYQVEGLGIQLFESIDGDYFTILGMPLLALLSELRRREVMAS